jgi:hypothetical protein
MGKMFKKLKQVIFNKLRKYRQKQEFSRISKRTESLKNAEKSDLERWENNKELLENWNERTCLMARMVPENANVIEFGAGNMVLKNYLPSNCNYQGSDIVQRSPEMKVCDLNVGIGFSLGPYDTAVFSGVLEYVYDVDRIFDRLNGEINRVVLSYACYDHFPVNRERMGWLSDYKKEELERIFHKYNYKIKIYEEWRRQSVFKLEKNGFKE